MANQTKNEEQAGGGVVAGTIFDTQPRPVWEKYSYPVVPSVEAQPQYILRVSCTSKDLGTK